jgi:hypothetical protein
MPAAGYAYAFVISAYAFAISVMIFRLLQEAYACLGFLVNLSVLILAEAIA